MIANKQIQYLAQHNIDKNKWDNCIQSTSDSLIYNYSWCLDSMCPGWHALVLNDYEAVMPLTWKKKYGIRYLYQPFFFAQAGITAKTVNPALTDAFITAIPAHFKFIDIDLNENNETDFYINSCRKRVNMLLDTRQNYRQLSAQYHRLANRMIKKALSQQIIIESGADIKGSITFYRKQYSLKGIQVSDYDKLTNMLTAASEKGHVVSLSAKKAGILLGVYLLLKDDHYIYSVIGGSSAQGKEEGVFYQLTDHAIKSVCNAGRLFRFEGSDMPGIANFNHQFGAVPFYYNRLKLNRLPFPLHLLKK